MFLPIPIPARRDMILLRFGPERSFALGETTKRILSYKLGASGWTDDLTELHESAEDENHYINVASRQHAVSRMERWVAADSPVLIDIAVETGVRSLWSKYRVYIMVMIAEDSKDSHHRVGGVPWLKIM
jgi:hypothetical protein